MTIGLDLSAPVVEIRELVPLVENGDKDFDSDCGNDGGFAWSHGSREIRGDADCDDHLHISRGRFGDLDAAGLANGGHLCGVFRLEVLCTESGNGSGNDVVDLRLLESGELKIVWYDGQPLCYFEKSAIGLPWLLSRNLRLRLLSDLATLRPYWLPRVSVRLTAKI